MLRLVLFDIDGTLIRTGGAGVKAFAQTFLSEFNLPHATREISFAGRTDPSLVREGFRRCNIEAGPDHLSRFFAAYPSWLKKLLPACEGGPCPGVIRLIEQFQKAAQPPLIGLLTGNVKVGAELKLKHYDLWDFFSFGAFADDNEDRNELAKVAKQRGQEILGRTLMGEEILVVGDTPHDITCGRAIEAQVLAVATGGYCYEDLHSCQPTWLCKTLESFEATHFGL